MGIDLEQFYEYSPEEKIAWRQKHGISSDKVVVGTIARLVPDKGIETFLACAQKMRDNRKLVFVIGGDGELRKDFEHQAQEAGMQ
ncbi:MAG: glycosyltransferase, partial [Candidatus Omnitrophota bacterium]